MAGSMNPPETANQDRLPVVGETIKVETKAETKSYKLLEKLGEGGYGNVFRSEDDGHELAIKTEKYSHSQIHIEVAVLKAVNAARCRHFCDLIGYASVKPDYVFVIMSLLGKDLHRLRCEMPDRKFSVSTALGLGYQTLRAIEELHKVGYLSRDVKPGNFAPGCRVNRQQKTIFFFDFGLCRKYVDRNNGLLASRGETGWRGTTRYGSLHAHERQDLARRDDIESWFYMLIENTRGTLPWRMITDRNAVFAAKKHARESGREQMLFECPKAYDNLMTWIDAMQFESCPEYEKIVKVLKDICVEKGCHLNDTWDWDEATNSTTTNTMSSYSDRETRAQKNKSAGAGEEKAKEESKSASNKAALQ